LPSTPPTRRTGPSCSPSGLAGVKHSARARGLLPYGRGGRRAGGIEARGVPAPHAGAAARPNPVGGPGRAVVRPPAGPAGPCVRAEAFSGGVPKACGHEGGASGRLSLTVLDSPDRRRNRVGIP
jgi:hypothetical protein